MRIKLFSFVVLLLCLSSCEEVTDADPLNEVEVEGGTRAVVTTTFEDAGCEVLLEIDEDGSKEFLIPVELEDKYKTHGLELLISYRFSRVMQSDCNIGRPIVIDKIKLVE